MLRAAVIIPALNEEESLGATLDRVPRSLFQTVIVADNGSADRTAEVAREHGAIVVSEPERGYGAACLAALAAVPPDTEAVAFMQADSSEDPEEAALLLAPIAEGRADLVLGSRVMGRAERGSVRIHQAFGNRLATFLIRILFGYRYADLGPFRAIRLESLRALGMRDRNYGWTVEMQIKALQQGLRVLEVPVSYRRRLAGEEKVSGNPIASVKAGAKILWTVAKLKVW
ncbi:MAG TPA: glycosyltransferase family 2 protein [Bryobacteraceae bacterium]|nr:glycosyltransferase family 2 protein [Bryobacteraceae bacterium]